MNNYLYEVSYDKFYDDFFIFKYKIIDIDSYEDILIYKDELNNKEYSFDMNNLEKVINNKIFLIGKEHMEEHELELKIIKILFREINYGR